MTTPTEELRQAADKLRTHAEGAAEGPWAVDGWNCIATARNEEVAEVWPLNKGDHNAAYIATMHPGVGIALAAWLDQAARDYECGISAANDVFHDDPAGREAFLTTGPGAPSPCALTVARAINGGAQ